MKKFIVRISKIKTIDFRATKDIKTGQAESFVEYRSNMGVWKGKVVKGRKIAPPSFPEKLSISAIINELWHNYGYMTMLMSIDGKEVFI